MPEKFKAGLAFCFLTPLYDRVSNSLGLGAPLMIRVLQIAGFKGNEKVLDIGSGTGSLIVEAKKRFPDLDIVGLDADINMLRRAKEKFERDGIKARLIHGFAQALPFPDRSFNVVVSTLVFHHLPTEVKKEAMREVSRVLEAGGRFILADFGKPDTLLSAVLLNLASLFDGRSHTRDNLQGRIPNFLEEAGFRVDEVRPRYRALQFLIARKSAN